MFIHENQVDLRYKFIRQDLTFFDGAKPTTTKDIDKKEDMKRIDNKFFQVDAEWCKECKDLFTISLRVVSRTFGGKGVSETQETIFEDLLVSQDTFNKIREAQDNFGHFVEPRDEPD
jgi:hypothetical protein